MLSELAVADLGVIDRLRLVFEPGMTAVTGETGAGKTLVVEALELLVGGRADGDLVRPGATEAIVEGRFDRGGEEYVVRRVIPRRGRSRAYLDDRLVTAARLGEVGAETIDLHGQHSHQSLLSRPAQRAALDHFAGIDLRPLHEARVSLAEITAPLNELGGDERELAREVDLLKFQLDEIRGAEIELDELDRLADEEALLADASEHREAGEQAVRALADEPGALSLLAEATEFLRDRRPFGELSGRFRSISAELGDAADELRTRTESIERDPQRLAEVQDRQKLLLDLRRKYGDSLVEVLQFADRAEQRLAEIDSFEERAGELERERRRVVSLVEDLTREIGDVRRRAVPSLVTAVSNHLHDLALPHAQLDVEVGVAEDDDIEFLITVNPGSPLLPLRKVASGGELARVMLALRLVLTAGPPVLVFDEVDAGVGGVAAQAVGRALSALADAHQVLVVTHLPQVAAFADHQVAVTKQVDDGRTVTTARALDRENRVVELSRMLAGSPESQAAQEHAEELLAVAARERSER